MLIHCLNVNVESTFVCQRWINVCMSTLNQRLYVNVESTLNQRLYVSVYSSFKFKYIFNIISTYIVNVESTLNQQTRAPWVYTTGWLNIHLIFYVIHEKIGLSHGNMICIISRKFMIYSPKYEVIALPGTVGIGGILSSFDFLLGAARPFGFLVEEWLFWFPIDEIRFSKTKWKHLFFLTKESLFIIDIRPYK